MARAFAPRHGWLEFPGHDGVELLQHLGTEGTAAATHSCARSALAVACRSPASVSCAYTRTLVSTNVFTGRRAPPGASSAPRPRWGGSRIRPGTGRLRAHRGSGHPPGWACPAEPAGNRGSVSP